MNFADVRPDAPHRLTQRTMHDYVEHIVNNHHADFNELCRIPGWHLHAFWEDVLHVDCLGLRQHACGNALLRLARAEVWGAMPMRGAWQDKLDVVLCRAFREFQEFLSANGLSSTQPRFRTLNLSMHRLADYPVLKAKGKNCVTVSKWLCEKALEHSLVSPDQENELLYTVLFGFVEFWKLIHDIRPRFVLTDDERDRLETYKRATLYSYALLSKRATARGEALFNIVPKSHAFDEMLSCAIRSGIAPSLVWTFGSEDAMSLFAKLSGKCHGSTVQSAAIDKWLVAFWSHHFGEDS